MGTTDYVSYPIALALKKAGFDEPCIAHWACEPDGKPMLIGSTAFMFNNAELKGRDVTAPLIYQAQKWLREVKRIEVNASWDSIKSYWFFYTNLMDVSYIVNLEDISDSVYSTYEQALSAGIAAALELIHEEKQ